jgi:hypothetical protein
MNKPLKLGLWAAALLSLAPATALAGPIEDAKVLFNVGAQAFDKGDYLAALQAFEAAYRLTPRPGVLFSIAQAHRKQYFTGGKQVEQLRAAISTYREYLVKVEQGGRRSDAAEALAELESLAAKLDVGVAAPPPAVVAPPVVTRIMITTQVADALISLDGGSPREAPLVADVQPGKHAVRATAPGYFDEAREVPVTAGEVRPVDVILREKPGRLTFRASDGAQVSIDGRLAATTPLIQPLDVSPGRHLVTVTRNGYRVYSHEIELARDEARTLDVKLDATSQRYASFALMGAGTAGIAVGAALAVVAIHQQKQAQSFDAARQAGALACATATDCQQLYAQYTQLVQSRDDFRRDAGVVLGAGALVGAVGLMLFAFDQPTLGGGARGEDTRKPAAPAPRERPMDLSAGPIVGPGRYGAVLSGRF